MERPILVGFNDSASARAALFWAGQEATGRDVSIVVLSVLPSSVACEMAMIQLDSEKRRRQMRDRATAVCRAALGATVHYGVQVREGSPASLLVAEAERLDASMVCVGATRHGAIGEFVMGSVVHDLVHRSPVPVVVVPASTTPSET